MFTARYEVGLYVNTKWTVESWFGLIWRRLGATGDFFSKFELDLPFCKILGEFTDLLSNSELLEKLRLQENDRDDLRRSRLEIMNTGRCYATRLYVAGFFSSYAIKELQEKKNVLEIYGTRKTRVVHHCYYSFWKLGSNTVGWQVGRLYTPAAAFSFDCILTLILRRSRTGTVWFYTSTSNKRAARPKLYTKSLTRDLKHMYIRLTLVRISINL